MVRLYILRRDIRILRLLDKGYAPKDVVRMMVGVTDDVISQAKGRERKWPELYQKNGKRKKSE